MSTLLHVAASPRRERSHSRRLAGIFIAEFMRNHPDFALQEVNTDAGLPAFGAAGASAKFKAAAGEPLNDAEQEVWSSARTLFERLAGADRVVISTPMWNFSMPYQLKNWIDCVTQPGWSFTAGPEGYIPLLGQKKALYVIACGSRYETPEMQARDLLRPYLQNWSDFVGLEYHAVALEGTVPKGERFDREDAAMQTQLLDLAGDF